MDQAKSEGDAINFDELSSLSTKHLHLIKWNPNRDVSVTQKLRIARTIAPKWKDIAILIGLDYSQITSIENPGTRNTPEMCIVEVLNKWQEMGQSMTTTTQDDCSYDYTYTWRGLLALLKDAEFEILAKDLCYALSSTTSSVKKIKQDRDEQTAIDTDHIPPMSAEMQSEFLKLYAMPIYEGVDINLLYPHLCQAGLLNESEQKCLNRHDETREHKISILLDIIPQKGLTSLMRFVSCIEKTADNEDHKKIYATLSSGIKQMDLQQRAASRNTSCRDALWLLGMAFGIFILGLMILAYFYRPGMYNILIHYQSKTLPYPSKIFVGREQEMFDLLAQLDFLVESDVRIVNIVGSPGIGKSILAIHVGDQMVKQGIVVLYVNMVDYQRQDIYFTLVGKIFKAAQVNYAIEFEILLKWIRSCFWNHLIIFDNCDEVMRNKKEPFFTALRQLVEQTPLLKILVTSREVTTRLEYFKRYPLYELSTRASCELLTQRLPPGNNLTTIQIEEIAKLTGNVPLALQIIGALFSTPNPPSSIVIIKELEKRPIPLLSDEKIPDSHKVNVTIDLSYRYLPKPIQKIARYLAYFPGSFHKDAAVHMANKDSSRSSDEECANKDLGTEMLLTTLNSLIHRSLIDYDIKVQRFQFHRLIAEFLREKQVSIGEKGEKERFDQNFHSYYSLQLREYAIKFKTSYGEALLELRMERHNFKKLLEDIESGQYSLSSFSVLINCLVKALSSKVLDLIFSDEDLLHPLQSALTYMETIVNDSEKRAIVGNIGTLYIFLVYTLAAIESRLYGLQKAIDTCEQKKAVIDSFTQFSTAYNNFYEQLGSYYMSAHNLPEAAACYARSDTNLKNYVSQCYEGSTVTCSKLNLGSLAVVLQKYNLANSLLEHEYHFGNHSGMEKLILLYNSITVSYHLRNETKLDSFCKEMLTFIENDVDSRFYSGIFIAKQTVINMIELLTAVCKKVDVATVLQGRLLEAVMDISAKPSVISTPKKTLEVVVFYYKRRNHVRVVQLVDVLLESLKYLPFEMDIQRIKVMGMRLRAESRIQSGNFSLGLNDFEGVIEIITSSQNLINIFKDDFQAACFFLIVRLKYIYICYKAQLVVVLWVFYTCLYTIFKIPLEPYYFETPADPPATSVFPELHQMSSSREVISISSLNTELGVDILLFSANFSIWDYIFSSPHPLFIRSFFLKFTLVRFILNVLSIYLRIYILTFNIVSLNCALLFSYLYITRKLIIFCLIYLYPILNDNALYLITNLLKPAFSICKLVDKLYLGHLFFIFLLSGRVINSEILIRHSFFR